MNTKRLTFLSAVAAICAAAVGSPPVLACGRSRTRDVALQFRMGAGFAGDVNRTHPAEIEPALVDEDDPPTRYGNALLVDTVTEALRQFIAADQSDATPVIPYGAIVRPYPTQQQSGTNYGTIGIGAATPPVSGVIDTLRNGLIMVQLNTGVATPKKGGRVYVWAAATAGAHVQGGYETELSAGNTCILDPRYLYNGAPDANGVTEISFNV